MKSHVESGEIIRYTLFERHIADKVPSTFDAFCQEHITGGRDCDNVRMLREKFKADGIVQLAGRLFA